MTDYTPTTDEVFEATLYTWVDWKRVYGDEDAARDGFDRWLAKERAEAQVEALREAADTLTGAEPSHLGDADEGLEFFDYGTGAEYGIDVAAAHLRIVANETAREAGIETKEATDD